MPAQRKCKSELKLERNRLPRRQPGSLVGPVWLPAPILVGGDKPDKQSDPAIGRFPGESTFMSPRPRRIAILGATGSIGRSTLEVALHSAGQLEVVALSAH